MALPKKKVYIRTFGCQMNVADSELMAQVLADDYIRTERAEEADLYLINTCAIRRKSEEKVRSLLGSLKTLKQKRPGLLLGVGGCVAQQEGDRLLSAAPHLNLVFGPRGIGSLPETVRRAAAGERPLDLRLDQPLPPRHRPPGAAPLKTLVTIMQGCNNFCSFCVVPYLRGREVSREPADILAEVADFLAAGGLEVTLLGQNVNSYGRGLAAPVTFPELLRHLAGMGGLKRLRFATSHPRDLSPELMAAFAELKVLCEHLHLPVQAGSNRILKAMNRGYTREAYLQKVAGLRQLCPGIAVSTDLIVGFPGETEADFTQTLELMQEAAFEAAFSFKYSPRPRTRAAALEDQVPEEVKAERLARLQSLQDELTLAAHRRLLGQVAEVLVEGPGQRPGQLSGRLRTNQVVNFTGLRELTGRLVSLELTEAHPHSLKGRWLEQLPAVNFRPLADGPLASPREVPC
jgi:tRNA-2-methylthio-N6-dimethylallyladenosine synthase